MKNRIFYSVTRLFLLLFLLPFASLLLLQVTQWYLKGTAKERMQQHQLVTITLPAAKAIWHKKGKELAINKKLFDVKDYQLLNGTLTATGFYDDEEISLTYLLSELTSPEKSRTMLHFLLVLQCFAAPLLLFTFGSIPEPIIKHCTLFFFLLPTPFCLLAEQPPRC